MNIYKGDIVRVTSPGETYSIYADMVKRLGGDVTEEFMKGYKLPQDKRHKTLKQLAEHQRWKYSESPKRENRYKVLNYYEKSNDTRMYLIEDIDGEHDQFLTNGRGIKFVDREHLDEELFEI